MDKLDKTIEALCDEVVRILKEGLPNEAAELTRALAELISARANATVKENN